MTIYSECFFSGQAPTTEETIYSVPVGNTVVLRDAEWLNVSQSTETLQLQVTVPGLGISVVCRAVSVASAGSAQWQGRVALPEGSSIQLAAPAANIYLCLSGYLLTP